MTKRQPEGIPAGGQFVAERKAEPTSTLDQQATPEQERATMHATLLKSLGGRLFISGEDIPGEAKETMWQSPAGNLIKMVESSEYEDFRAWPVHAAGRYDRELEIAGPHIVNAPMPQAQDQSHESMAVLAKAMDHQVTVAMAWHDSVGPEPSSLRSIEVRPDNTASIFGVDPHGNMFWFEHDSRGELTGFKHGSDSQKHPMDEIDMDAYAQRLVGRENHAHLILRSTLERTKLLVSDREQHNLSTPMKEAS